MNERQKKAILYLHKFRKVPMHELESKVALYLWSL